MDKSKLEFIILCENAFINDQDKKLSIINIFDGINTYGFPAVHPKMSAVVKLEIGSGEHKEYMKITENSNEIARTKEVSINVGMNNKHQIVHNFENLIFPKQGEYAFKIFVDGENIGETRIKIDKIQTYDRN